MTRINWNILYVVCMIELKVFCEMHSDSICFNWCYLNKLNWLECDLFDYIPYIDCVVAPHRCFLAGSIQRPPSIILHFSWWINVKLNVTECYIELPLCYRVTQRFPSVVQYISGSIRHWIMGFKESLFSFSSSDFSYLRFHIQYCYQCPKRCKKSTIKYDFWYSSIFITAQCPITSESNIAKFSFQD